MRYEITIALRYLISKQSAREPTIIGLLTIAGLALSTGMMIIVLAVFAGFEGDLRDKILGTHAHILITGPDEEVVSNPDPIVEKIREAPNVVGVSPFVESEVMIASQTNYSGMVVRGLDNAQPLPASDFSSYLIEGELDWLSDSRQAFSLRQRAAWDSENPTFDEIEDLQRQISNTQRDIERIRSQAKLGLDVDGNPLPDFEDDSVARNNLDRNIDPETLPNARRNADRDNQARDDDDALMPALPTPAHVGADAEDAADNDARMPSLPAPFSERSDADSAADDAALMPALPPPRQGAKPSLPSTDAPPAQARSDEDAVAESDEDAEPDLPGIVIGTELQSILNVLIGDTVNLITPDGDLGPNGLIPRSRPFRVVGVFYTGFYLYDSGMGIVDIDDARGLLNIPRDEVTGIEVRTPDLHSAYRVADALSASFDAADMDELEVRDWRELNQSLFVALKVERMAMAAVLIFFIAISGLLVLLVVWMFVIEKRKEIAILKAIGATRGNIMRIFLSQGVAMGIVGAGLGLLLALGFVVIAVYVGIPLNPDDYYIDRLPIEVSAWEFVLVTLSALVVTVFATLLPALQAARLDPVMGLRDDQDNN